MLSKYGDEADKAKQDAQPTFTDAAIENMIDESLALIDTNKDGFVDWLEYTKYEESGSK